MGECCEFASVAVRLTEDEDHAPGQPELQCLSAIRSVARGEKAVAAEVLKMIAEGTPEPTLTERQTEVIDLLARGFTNSEIAKFLGISPDGVNDHIRGILRKLGAANRTEAVAIALRKHLLKI